MCRTRLEQLFLRDPSQSAATRREFLEKHAGTSTLIMPAHFPTPGAGRVVEAGDSCGLFLTKSIDLVSYCATERPAAATISLLGLRPHPEGGLYRKTPRDTEKEETQELYSKL